ncbi:hypothetical protein [Clostridium beijerinckii]|uniref:Uncharacterized protein n=1 Tax=Clostridium beijerinckii TaxID=1520 RepID=A0A1S8RVP5_CLOBE|nr:hypothetical protein [Clostridium beijerinckii]NRY62090.1 hypothetical protein [Clostridium beijerinckii]OOM57267.1 hypothetical protein CLBCK_42000 [Clostridium beijerinckii]
MNNSSIKNVVLEILLIVSIILAILSMFLKYVVLNESIYLNIFSKSGTYGELKEYIYVKIDNVLSSKGINIDIKESIITEEDIKKEADNTICGFLEYLKTGENNVKPIDTSVYKQRVSDVLNSIMDNIIKPNSSDISLNDKFQTKNMVSTKGTLQVNRMDYIKPSSKGGQDNIKVERLMSKSEAEAKVREILKQKGLTEEEAIEKATKKGITEEQALKILAGYGITIDGDEPEESNNSTTVPQNSGDDVTKSQNSNNQQSKEETASNSNKEDQNAINNTQDGRSPRSKLDNIKSKLADEASKSIDKEVEKMNFNKIFESNKVQKLTQITSTIYKLFWVFIIIPIIIMCILIKINAKGLDSSLKYIGTAFFIAGLILVIASSSIHYLKAYENINAIPVYLKDTTYNIANHIFMLLSKYGVTALVIGSLLFISGAWKKVLTKKV